MWHWRMQEGRPNESRQDAAILMVGASDILQGKVLIVDDQEADVVLLEEILRRAGYRSITSTTEPSEVRGLHLKNHYDLILLDIEMPGMDGFQVLEELKNIPPDGYLPVLVIANESVHKLSSLRAGAKDFISKPFELAELLARVHNMLEVRLLHEELSTHNDLLEEQVRERTADLRESQLETVFTLMRAVEHRDAHSGVHVQRISLYSRELAGLLGLDGEFVDRVSYASPMHDVGKIGTPDGILLKPGALTPEEWEVMKRHTLIGARILGNSRSRSLTMGAEIALNHHERWNGGGYPNGRRGEAIPLAARIMTIGDVYDALRSERPYKSALSHSEAMAIIMQGDGRTQPEHFDPAVLAVFEQNHLAFSDIFESHPE